MLTDTTFWIDLLEERQRRRPSAAHEFLAQHRSHELLVSIITWGELAAGVDSYDELNQLLRRIHVLPLALQIAWEGSRIDRELKRTGGRLGENDNWIAATARAAGLALVTRDEAFQRVPGLRVVAY
jgi:predicted nucleic acid-binding protein